MHIILLNLVLYLCLMCQPSLVLKEGYQFQVYSNVDHPMAIINITHEDARELIEKYHGQDLLVIDTIEGERLLFQWLENELLIGIRLKAGIAKTLLIQPSHEISVDPKERTFAKFVPERTDDFAWENDKVAFRTYGPDAMNRVLEGKKGGTLSSGIDVWHKKVSYPIIEKWYHKELNTAGTYHQDDGEGADFFHVGTSRGVGGTGFWAGDTLYAAHNFLNYEIIASGPLRTIFKLKYGAYQAENYFIKETKIVSLDLGSNLTKFEIEIEQQENSYVSYLTAGLTLHENEGEVFTDVDKGYFGYWEPLQNTKLGTAIVPLSTVKGFDVHRSLHTDQSQLLVHLPISNGKTSFYAGFAWDQAAEIIAKDAWENYLIEFINRLNNQPNVKFLKKL